MIQVAQLSQLQGLKCIVIVAAQERKLGKLRECTGKLCGIAQRLGGRRQIFEHGIACSLHRSFGDGIAGGITGLHASGTFEHLRLNAQFGPWFLHLFVDGARRLQQWQCSLGITGGQ